ncbi:MAG: GIY-YIG nuclease family protein [Patescibacteria group bacterium]
MGYTEDLKKRFQEHNAGFSLATKVWRPWKLVYYEAFQNKSDALKREKQLKHFKKAYGELKRRISGSLS